MTKSACPRRQLRNTLLSVLNNAILNRTNRILGFIAQPTLGDVASIKKQIWMWT